MIVEVAMGISTMIDVTPAIITRVAGPVGVVGEMSIER